MRSKFSRKWKVAWTVNKRFRYALIFTIECLVYSSLHFEDQIEKHVAKCVSMLKVQIKPKVFELMGPFQLSDSPSIKDGIC